MQFPAIKCNDSVTKLSLINLYGLRGIIGRSWHNACIWMHDMLAKTAVARVWIFEEEIAYGERGFVLQKILSALKAQGLGLKSTKI